jgi:ribonuclease HI
LDWFSIDHALREHNREADELANRAMDSGTGRVAREPSPAALSASPQEFEGVVRSGAIKLLNGELPEGTRVQVRVKK